MNYMVRVRTSLIATLLLITVASFAVACGGASDETTFNTEQNLGEPGGTDANVNPTPFPQSTSTPPSLPPSAENGSGFGGNLEDSDLPAFEPSPLDEQVAQVAQQRIIVRNVDMTVEAPDIAVTINEISNIAVQRGGWVVRSQKSEVFRGSLEIRVPADRVDETLELIRDVVSGVTSEVSTSQDFTEEFTDTTARIQTMQDTVDALRVLFDRADEISDALAIQREITEIQSEIDAMQARINLLSETSAFSLVRITVNALPQEVEIAAGEDLLGAVGRPVRFRAQFTPPEGIDDFRIEWNFGDGTSPQAVTAVAPVNTEGLVISAPVTHVYGDDTDSPYIVKVKVNGTGSSGAAEGEDVVVVTINRVSPIEVFAGENQAVEAGETVKLRGSFTRPDGVSDLSFTWDFGDGSAPVTVVADPGARTAEIDHEFANSRPQDYNVVLTVRGDTAAGATEGAGSVKVRVSEPSSLTAGTFNPGESSKSALRALTAIGSHIGTALIYLAVLSPLWVVAGVAGYFFYRNSARNRNRRRRTAERLAANAPGDMEPNV